MMKWICLLVFLALLGCKTNVFESTDELNKDERDDKEISELVLNKNFEEAERRLRERIARGGKNTPKLKAALAKLLLNKLGMTDSVMLKLISIKDRKEQLQETIKAAPQPTPENLEQLKEAADLLKSNEQKNAIQKSLLQAARATYVASLLKKTRGDDGETFSRKAAEANLMDQDVNDLIDGIGRAQEDSESTTDDDRAKLETIRSGSADERKKKLIKHLQEQEE